MSRKIILSGLLLISVVIAISGRNSTRNPGRPLKTSEPVPMNESALLPAQVKFGINTYTTVPMDNTRADTILSDGVKLLKDKDGADDVSCTIDVVRDGSVTTFNVAKGIIDSDADFDAVCATGGRVHMVKEIHDCGGPGPNIIGCAPIPGTCMVLVRQADALEGILWMHEYGHNQGLNHRSNKFALMTDAPIAIEQKRVNASECTSYQTVIPLGLRGRPQPRATHRSLMNVTDFVRQIFIHGVPYAEASSYSPKTVPQLLKMLADPREEQSWANIVVVLGAIGDARAVQPLIDFLTADVGTVSEGRYKAKVAVLMSLGYLINRSGNRRALEFLTASLSPSAWAGRVKWLGPASENESDQSEHLTKLAIWGLGISGNREAGDKLRAFRKTLSLTDSSNRSLRDVLDEAIAFHVQVVRFGLTDTYRRKNR